MNLEEALSELDAKGSGYDIAVFLIDEGIKGQPNSSHDCPLAIWLSRVTGRYVHVGCSMAGNIEGFDGHVLPDNVVAFRVQFDQGHWPALVSE